MPVSRHDLARALLTGTIPAAARGDVSFWDLARAESVLPFAARAIARTSGVPADIAREARDEEARALADEHDLRAVLAEFAARDIPVLVIKGAAVACTIYGTPGLRPRLDTDLLIARDDIDRVHELFRDLGGRHLRHVTGEYVMSQFHYVRTDRAGCEHAYDIHWRVVNPAAFAGAFEFDSLRHRSVPLPVLGPAARGPGVPDGLLIACAHRAAHHSAGGPLLWLLDIHLLAESLTAAERSAFVSDARRAGLTAVVSHALLETASCFEGSATGLLASELEKGRASDEPTAAYLQPRSRLRETAGDLATLGWSARMRLLRELAFPPADYMRTVYAARHRGPLPVLYARRLLTGLVRWGRRRD